MHWPLSQDYNEAIQSPESSFSDTELKQAEARVNAIGIPMPRSGNFADVYEMTHPSGKKWAVKCFTRQVAGLREHYAAISAYLKQANLPFMVEFSYLDQGLKVKGQWYPVLKMQWVEGLTLNEFVKEHADQPQYLELLSQIWLRLARRLREANLAHCDLQHGNVLLVPGAQARSLSVKLIDYDGMCVPALADKKSGEVGHPAYQHPQRLRDGTYHIEVDRFPHLVIYTALRSLMVGGRYLWNKYDNGDNLLFRQADLEAPANSALFAELRKLSDAEAGELVKSLGQAAQQPLEQTPLLDELGTDKAAVTARPRSAAVPVEATAESLFASATTGAAAAPSTRTGRRAKKSSTWVWAAAAVAVLGVGAAGAIFLSGKGTPKDTAPATPAGKLTLLPIPAVTLKAGEEALLEIKYDSGHPAAIPSIQFQGYPAGLQFQRESIDPQKAVYKLIASASADNSTGQVRVTLSLNDQQAQGQVQITLHKRDAVIQRSGGGGEIRQFVGHTGSVASVVFSSDGRRALSASEDRTMRLWDLDSGKELRRFEGHTATVSSVAFSPGGQRVLSGSQDKTVRLWDAEFGKELQQFEKHSDVVWTVAFSPDGLYALSGSRDKTARLWETKTGKELQRFEGHTGCVHTAVFSPDGRHVLTGSCDHSVRLWDAKTGKMLRRFDGHTQQVHSLAFRPDGRTALSGSWDTTLRLWDMQTGMELRRFHGHTDVVQSIAISPDGRLALSGSGGQVRDGKTVASTDNTLRLWDLESGKELRCFNGHADSVRSVAFSHDGGRALSGSNDRTVRLWALPSTPTPGPLQFRYQSVAFSPDGKRIATAALVYDLLLKGFVPGDVSVWDAATGKLTSSLETQIKGMSAVAFSPDGKWLAAAGSGGMSVWDLETRKQVVALQSGGMPPGGGISRIDFSPDGKFLASACGDGSVKLWDLSTGRSSRAFSGQTGYRSHVAFNKDGSLLASACAQTVKVWNVKTGAVQQELRGHAKQVFCVDFSPDGKTLASASQDGVIKVWDLDTGKEIMSRPSEGPRSQFYSVVFSPDGKRLAAGGNSSQVTILNPLTGRALLVLPHPGRIFGVAFSPDGSRLVSGSELQTIRVWDALTGRQIVSTGHPPTIGAIPRPPPEPSRPPANLAVGSRAPDIEGEDIAGKKFKLSDYRGKVIFLAFWGHWCGPCRAMYPQDRALVKRLDGKPFVFLGVNSDPDKQVLNRLLEQGEITWRFFVDGRGGPIAKNWNIQAWPHLFLIDHRGVIRLSHTGNPGEEILHRKIDELLAEIALDRNK